MSCREAAKPRCLIPRLVLSPPECFSLPTDDPLPPGTVLGPEKGTFLTSRSSCAVPRYYMSFIFLGRLEQEPADPSQGTQQQDSFLLPQVSHHPPFLAQEGPRDSSLMGRRRRSLPTVPQFRGGL